MNSQRSTTLGTTEKTVFLKTFQEDNIVDYLRSIKDEIIATHNRVSLLVHHHGEEGVFREAVLRNIIKRFLPRNLNIGTGFVVRYTEGRYVSSTQIDILIFDIAYPVLFSEGDFYIVDSNAVRGVIEVKTSEKASDLSMILHKLNKIGEMIQNKYDVFIGLYSFSRPDGDLSTITKHLAEMTNYINPDCGFPFVNHIVLGGDLFFKYWDENPHRGRNHREFGIYDFDRVVVRDSRINDLCAKKEPYKPYQGLAPCYFINNLIHKLSGVDIDERLLFPPVIEKEKARIETYYVSKEYICRKCNKGHMRLIGEKNLEEHASEYIAECPICGAMEEEDKGIIINDLENAIKNILMKYRSVQEYRNLRREASDNKRNSMKQDFFLQMTGKQYYLRELLLSHEEIIPIGEISDLIKIE